MSVTVKMRGADGALVSVLANKVLLEIDGSELEVVGDPAAATPAPAQAPATSLVWTRLGAEGDTITVPAGSTVRYGAAGSFVFKEVSGEFRATNEFFGSDPASGVLKTVELRAGGSAAAPAPSPAPAGASPAAGGALARIGQRTFGSLVDAAEAAADGEVIEILRPGRLQEATAAFHKQQRHEIAGVGGRHELRIDGSFRPAWGKGVIVHEGGDLTVRNLVIAGANVPEDNGAGIRTGDRIGALLVEDCDLVDNENGALLNGGATSASATFRRVNFRANGRADNDPDRFGRSHNIYCNAIARLTIEDSTSTDCVHGHSIKTRAIETHLVNVKTRGAKEGRELDVPNGGVLHAKGCSFTKPTDALQKCLIGIGQEGGWEERVNRFVFEDCDFTILREGTKQLLDNATSVPVEFVRCKGLDQGYEMNGPFVIK